LKTLVVAASVEALPRGLLGRKNWLHIGSEEAGTHVAAVASVVETCKRNAICVKE